MNVVVSAVVIVVAAFVPAMNPPPAAPGTASGRLLTVPVGCRLVEELLEGRRDLAARFRQRRAENLRQVRLDDASS